MNIIYSILIAIAVAAYSTLYFTKGRIKESKGFKNKVKTFISLSKKQTAVVAAALIFEIITFYVGMYIYNAELLMTLRWQAAVGLMIPIAAIDLKKQIIPNFLLLGGLGLTVILLALQALSVFDLAFNTVGTALIGSVVAGGIFFFSSLFVKNGIGAGDIKLFLMLGLLLALRGIFNVLLYSMIISAVFSIVLLISRKKKAKDVLPLAPFAMIGIALSIAFGV